MMSFHQYCIDEHQELVLERTILQREGMERSALLQAIDSAQLNVRQSVEVLR